MLSNSSTPALLLLFLLNTCGATITETRKGGQSIGEKPTSTGPISPPEQPKGKDFEFDGFAVIREFGGNDNAALFGITADGVDLTISEVSGPNFIQAYRVGKLTPGSLDKLFQKSRLPMGSKEKEVLLSKFSDATVIYAEGYEGNICNFKEFEHKIVVTGIAESERYMFEFDVEATPNQTGSCNMHRFGLARVPFGTTNG
jgi:hypothetical protein